MALRALLWVVAAGLAGCASNEVSAPPHQPKANAAWRGSLGDATFIALAAGETREFRITPDLQTFGFPEGISYFVGLALAPSDAPRTLTLRTLPINAARTWEAHVFLPRVAVVGANGSVIRYVGLEFQPSTQWIVPRLVARNTGWEGKLTLAPGESRIAVYTETLLRQTLRLPMPNQADNYWYVPSGPTGVIEVTLDGP